MSYADILLQRRQQMEGAFRKRYNPAEDVLASLSDIEKQMQDASALKEKQRLEQERFGLEKTRTEAETAKLKAETEQAREDRAALARERDARAAAAREEARRKEQEAALTGGARDIYGRLLSKGQTMKDVLEGSQAQERRDASEARRKDYAQKMADAMEAGNSTEVARLKRLMDEELQSSLKEGKPTAGGYTEADIQEMADAHGVPYGAMLTALQQIDAENEASRAEMGLTTQKSDTEKARAEAQRALAEKYGRQGFPKPEKEKTGPEQDLKLRRLQLANLMDEAKLARYQSAAGLGPNGELTDAARTEIQQRYAKSAFQSAALVKLRDLINQYPDLKNYTGPIDQYYTKLRSKLGDQKAAEIISTFQTAFSEYKLAVTGQASGEYEMKNLESNMPGLKDDISTVIGKLKAHENLFQQKMAIDRAMINSRNVFGADALIGVTPSSVENKYTPAEKQEADSLGIQLEQ
jgi:hypothetical protein